MRFVFALTGSRGDVQPALPVAIELRRRGHDVTVGVAPNLLDAVERLGLDPVAVGADSAALLGSDLVRHELRSPDPRVRLRALREVSAYGWSELRESLLPLAEDADVIVTGLLGQEVGSAVAERVGSGFAALHYCPVRPNGSVALTPGGPRVRKALWELGLQGRWLLTRRAENAERAALGLAPARISLEQRLRDRGAIEVQAYDPVLVPGLADELGPQRPFTGFLALDDAHRTQLGETDVELDAWIDGGTPPVYVGFGSMPVRDPEALLGAVAEATARLGLRALVSTGWNAFGGETPAHVRVVGAVDHATVLPRCAAAVHHGGAGTTAATLRAGIPTVVGWYSADQPMWGRLLRQAGVGTALRAASIDADSLTEALRTVLEPTVAERARALAGQLISPAAAVTAAADVLQHA